MTASCNIGPPVLLAPLTSVPLAVRASGEGSNGDEPVTEVRGTEGCCRNAIPDDIHPERGQVPDNLSPDGSIPDSKEVRHVLHEDVSRSKLANGSEHLAPQNGLGMIEPVELACRARALAGESAGDDVDSNSVNSDGSDVVVASDSGPPLGEQITSPRVDFAEPFVLKSGEVQAVGEEAAPVEESADREGIHSPLLG